LPRFFIDDHHSPREMSPSRCIRRVQITQKFTRRFPVGMKKRRRHLAGDLEGSVDSLPKFGDPQNRFRTISLATRIGTPSDIDSRGFPEHPLADRSAR